MLAIELRQSLRLGLVQFAVIKSAEWSINVRGQNQMIIILVQGFSSATEELHLIILLSFCWMMAGVLMNYKYTYLKRQHVYVSILKEIDKMANYFKVEILCTIKRQLENTNKTGDL